MKVDGLTLVQELTNNIHAWRQDDPDVTRGAGLYKDIKDKFGDRDSVKVRLLNMLQDNLNLTDGLVGAMEHSQKGSVNNNKVQAWIQYTDTATQDDVVLLMQWALTLNPNKDKHRPFLFDLIRFFQEDETRGNVPRPLRTGEGLD